MEVLIRKKVVTAVLLLAMIFPLSVPVFARSGSKTHFVLTTKRNSKSYLRVNRMLQKLLQMILLMKQ